MVTAEQFSGCLLGLALGDALGAPFEGLPAEVIWYDFGGARRAINSLRGEPLHYTDDAQMMVGVAEVLAEHGHINVDALAQAFARNYEPARGYGQGARRVLEGIAGGGDVETLARSVFPGGSLGNGAAMRVAPVGVCFADDLDAVEEQAVRSALPTHVHPVGIDGARLVALAVALAVEPGPFDRGRFYQALISRAATEEFRERLEHAAALGPDDSAARLGTSLEAHRSVVTAIECFASSPDSFMDAVTRAVGLGGDTDTIAAMAGAMVGARLGSGALPDHFLLQLEDGAQGRRYIEMLARRLYQRFVRSTR